MKSDRNDDGRTRKTRNAINDAVEGKFDEIALDYSARASNKLQLPRLSEEDSSSVALGLASKRPCSHYL
jgi:hypothetical protein